MLVADPLTRYEFFRIFRYADISHHLSANTDTDTDILHVN